MPQAGVYPDDAPIQPPRRRALRIIGWVLGIVLALVFAVWLVLFITKGRFLKPYFERFATNQLKRPVHVGGEFNLYFAPLNIAFRADGLTIDNPSWARRPQFFAARQVALSLRTLPLLIGKRRIAWADLDGAQVAAEWDKRHRHNTWTFGDPDAPPTPLTLPDIARGNITNTLAYYTDPVLQLDTTTRIHPVAATNSHIQQTVGFAGTGTLRARSINYAGRVEQADGMMLHGGGSGLVLHATGNDVVLDMTGRMPGLTQVADGKYHLAVRGGNMAHLFDFLGAVVVPTRRYHLTANMAQADGNWNFTAINGIFGDSDLAGRLMVSYAHDRLRMDGDLTTRSLDLIDAAPFLGYDPKRLDALGTKGLVTQVGGHPRVLPDAPLRSDELKQFDAGVRYRVGAIAARNFPISNIDVTLDLDHGLMVLRPVRAIVSTGRVEGAFTIDARPAVVLADYDMHLYPTAMSKLFARFGLTDSGTTGTLSMRMKLTGRGNSLRDSLAHANGRMVVIVPAGTIWAGNVHLAELNLGAYAEKALGKQLKEPVAINCGLLGFTVNQGIATLDPVLIDTKKSVIAGTGQFSFRDESLALSVRTRAKGFSLFSLQSPIGVDGYFAKPGIKIVSGQLLKRVGASVVLGVVATPVAALLAFIDPGGTKAAACGPVLAGARADAQRTTDGKPRKDVVAKKK